LKGREKAMSDNMNDGFAEIFAAEMTGDTTEIEKMKEIFPETYKIYSDMVKDAK